MVATRPGVGVIVGIDTEVVAATGPAQATKSTALKKKMKSLTKTIGMVQFVLDLSALENVRQQTTLDRVATQPILPSN